MSSPITTDSVAVKKALILVTRVIVSPLAPRLSIAKSAVVSVTVLPVELVAAVCWDGDVIIVEAGRGKSCQTRAVWVCVTVSFR